MNRLALGFGSAFLLCASLFAGGRISSGPRELGIMVLEKLNINDGKVTVNVGSGGCTSKGSLRVNVQKVAGVTERSAHYELTFERVRVDDCKSLAFDEDGIELKYDLADELGITGLYTISVTNWVRPRSQDSIVREMILKRELIAATQRAIAMEVSACEQSLLSAQGGLGPAGNSEKFTKRMAELKRQQEAFQIMEPFHYQLGTAKEPGPEAFFESVEFGSMTPSPKKILKVELKEPYKAGSILQVEGMTRSGPFYRAVGIVGNDYAQLKPGKVHEITVHLIYKREYFGLIPDFYVYIMSVK